MLFETKVWTTEPDALGLNDLEGRIVDGFAAAEEAVAAAQGGQVRLSSYTTEDFGDGSTNFDAALSDALSAMEPGSQLLVDIPGTLLVGDPIKLPSLCTIQGLSRFGTMIKAENGSNLNAVIASHAWADNDSSFNLYHTIRSLSIDPNKGNQSSGDGHGIALWCYQSKVDDVLVYGGLGDCLRISGSNRAGTESGTASQAYVLNSEFRHPEGAGIRVFDGDASTDQNAAEGYIINCQVEDVGTDGISVDSAAGWTICGNHLYGLPGNGIKFGRGYATTIVGNYIQDWAVGAAPSSFTVLAAINGYDEVTQGPVVVGNNLVKYSGSSPSDSDVFLVGIHLRGSNSAISEYSVTGNTLVGSSAPGGSYGIFIEPQGATATVKVTVAGNQVSAFTNDCGYNANGGTLTVTDPSIIKANNQTGTAYTFVLSDAGKVVEGNNASAITWTVPPNSSVAFPIGTAIELWQQGVGQISVAAGVGVTIRSPDGLKIASQYSGATLRKRGTNEWALEGRLGA